MANNTEDIKWLYDKLRAKGYDIGSQQEFTSSLANQADRDWYYDKAVGMGLDMGSKDDFNALYAPQPAKPAPASTPQQTSAPTAQADTAMTATLPPSPATPQSAPTANQGAQQPASAPAPQPTWQPTEQDKIRMAYNHNSMMSDFNARSRARVEQTRRATERMTPEGRRKLKAAKFQAQLAGTPTQVMGMTPDVSAAPSGQSGQGEGGEQAKPLLSGQGPVPYGVVEVDGQRKTQWLLPDGSLTTDFAEADKAEYGARRVRLMNQFVGRMKENGLDPSKKEDVQRQAQLDYEAPIRKAVAAAVQADDERSDKEQEAYTSNPLNMIGGVNAALGHAASRKQAGIGDLSLIAENAYNSLPSAYRRDLIASYTDYFTQHPEDTHVKTIEQAATDAAKSVVYGQVHEEYVKRNGPQSKNEFFIRKMLELNPASVALSGTINPYGQAYAELDAMERYGAEHRGLDIAGMVAGMAMDPTTYLGGWAGNIAFKNATRAAGKVMAKKAMGDVAGRYASTTLAGRIIGGMAAGGANFGTFEAVKDAERQLYQGGYLNPETGEMEGFSFGSVLNSGVHGIGMGAATGVVSPLIGNVADGWVKATTSTAGKAALRTGETAVSKLFEGTIFAAPDVYAIQTMPDEQFDKLYSKQYGYDTLEDEQEKTDARKEARKDLSGDAWSESMAMMMGFGLSHAIKTAPAMIRSLRPVKPTGDRPLTRDERIHNNKSFAERLRERLDQSPSDISMSDEEREELKRKGYGDLSDLFTRSEKPTEAAPEAKLEDGAVDFPRAEAEELGRNPEFDGYEAMERLMQDKNVSQATRAKAYFILTGRMLPMATITGNTTEQDADGFTIVNSVGRDGEVITSRRFASERKAQGEIDNINRQAELNTIDVGERYAEEAISLVVLDKVKDIVAARHRLPAEAVENIYMKHFNGERLSESEMEIVKDVDSFTAQVSEKYQSLTPAAMREKVNEQFGVDVDDALRKTERERTEAENNAVKEYASMLFQEAERQRRANAVFDEQYTEMRAEEKENRRRAWRMQMEGKLLDFDPEVQAEADRIYEESHRAYERFEQGDPEAQAEIDAISLRMTEAHQLCEEAFGDEAEVYMAEIKENPWGTLNNPELTPDQKDAVLYYINAKAALDGVLDASNEAAADKRQKVQGEVAHRTHKERGVIVPATMKADDKPVYIIKGDVAMFPDGSGVDASNSSNDVIILDESGEYKFTSPDQIMSVGETIDPQTELQTAYEAIDREQEAIISAAIEGVPESDEIVLNSGENEEIASETAEETPESVPNEQEYDRGYEEGTQIATTLDDNILNAAIDDLRGRDFLSDEWRGRLEAYEYEQQRRAMEGSQASPENIPEEGNNAGEDIPDNAPEEEKAQSALQRIPVDEQTGDPILTHESVDAETAWDAATEFFGTPEDALAYVQAEIGNAKTAITTAEKAVSKVKPTGGMTKYRNDLKAARNRVEAAKNTLAKWQAIEEAQKRRKAEEAAVRAAETAARNAQLHDEAVARFEEEQRIKAEKQAEQERIGTHAVNPKIKEKWDASPKVDGHPDVITLPDGSTLTGHYVMTEAGAASASHDVNNAFEPTEGFPIDKHGQSVNDRDYKRDRDAQQIVHNMADSYDSRAMQTPVFVSKDGIVLSGNNRTMSGDIAAAQGTDGAYLEYLSKYGAKYGFTPEQVATMKHPRVVFVPDDDLPYDANTFSRFNAPEMKSQSKPEAAIKLGKIVDDAVFNRIVADLNRYDRLSDFYADQEAAARTLGDLVAAGVINDKQLPELRTGTALSAAGKELIENTLIGKIFQAEPDAVRMIISMPTLRQGVILGLNEIANNRTLAAKDYDLGKELSAAVDLVFRAKTASPDIYKDGIPVSPFGRMQGLFDDEYGESRVTDATTLILADLFNSTKPSDVRKVLAMYNKSAGESAAGMVDIFSETGKPDTKEEILTRVNEHFRNATPKEQQALVDAAIEQRKREAEQAAAEQAGRGETGNETQSSDERSREPEQAAVEPEPVSEPEKNLTPEEEALTARIEVTENEWEEGDEKTPTYKREIIIDGKHKVIQVDTPDRKGDYTDSAFDYDGKTFSYLGEVADYIDKQQATKEEPQPDEPGDEKPIAGLEGYTRLEIKDIVKLEVEQTLSDADIDAEIVGMEIHGSRSRGDARPDSDLDIVLEYKGDAKEYAMFNAINETPIEIDGIQVDVNPIRKEETGTLPDYMKKSRSYDEEKIREAAASAPSLGERIAEAEATVNTEPTEAQKEAGNYRKGHVQVGTFDVTIENPKGSRRSGTDADGTPWETTMTHTYGYIKGTKGVDGDHIDVYLSSDIDDWDGRKVFVVDQYNPDGTFDEHKVMLGFNDRDEAYSAYLSNYEKGWEDGRRLDCTEVNLEDFEKWIESSKRKTKAFAEYKRVRTTCPVCGKAHISDYKSNDVTCPQCGTDLSVFRQIDQLTDDEAAELSDKFKGEDKQGNPIDHMGRLIVEDVMKIDEVCDGDFTNPTRTVGLPELPGKVSDAIGAEGRKPIIKKNIFVKNRDSHKDLTPEDGRKILKEVLYNPDLYGQNQKVKRPYNWILVHLAEKNSSVILEVNPTKDHLEIVNWHYLNGRQLEQKKRQAEREGGRILTLQESNAAGDASQGLSSGGKDNALLSDKQGKGAESSDGYTIMSTTYTNKKGKTSDVWLVKFGRDLSKEEKAALDTYIREPLAEGRKTPRGWYDSKEGGYMMRSEEAAKGLAGMLGNDEAVADAQPLSAKDYKDATGKPERTSEVPKPIPMNRVDVEGLFNDLRTKGETKVPVHAEPVSPKSEPEPKRMVVDDEMRDMENELRSLLGIDDSEGDRGDLFRNPEDFTNKERMQITSLGITYALKYFDQGIVSFPDFADKMVRRMGEKIRPWLKAFYGGARDIPGYDHLPFTPADEVKAFDVMNFDKAEKDTDPMRTAQGIVSESRAEVAVTDAQREITEQRNQKRKERDEQTTADTETIAKQAEAIASEAEATAESAVDEQSIAEASEKVDEALEKVNEQLALLGYYEAEQVDKDFNEAYGYMRNAEKKALADAVRLAKQLVKDLGIEIDKVTSSTTAKKSKKRTAVTANIAPAGGDISIRLPLNEGRELSINIYLDPTSSPGEPTYSGDNLQVSGIMYRMENPNGTGHERYGSNSWASVDGTYSELLHMIQRETYRYLPERSTKKGEYRSGDSIQYSSNGGKSWTDGKVVEVNHDGSLKLDTGLAPVLYVNATQEQVRRKEGLARAEPSKKEPEKPQFPDPKDKEAVSDWLSDNSAAIWEGVDAITKDAKADTGLRNTFKATNDDSIKEADLSDFVERWLADRIEDMMELHPETVKAWYDYDQQGIILSTIAGRIEDALAKEVKSDKKSETVNGYKRGDEVLWDRYGKGQWEKQTISDFDESGRPILDSFGQNWITEVADWERIKPVDGKEPKQDTPAETSESATEKAIETLTGKKKEVRKTEVKPKQVVGDLFGGLFDEPINSNEQEKTDVQSRTGTSGRGEGHEPRQDEPVGTSQRNEDGGTDGRGMAGRSGSDTEPDPGRGVGVSSVSPEHAVKPAKPDEPLTRLPQKQRRNRHNHVIKRGSEIAPVSVDARIKANIEAIETMKRLASTGADATAEDMAKMRAFSGWGGLGKAFSDWDISRRLRQLVGEQAFSEDAQMSRNSAYFTPGYVVDAMWDVARSLGFRGGNVLEGSAGIGNIIGLMPPELSDRSAIQAVEKDTTTGTMLSLLYPDAKVDVQGFEETKIQNGSIDLAITNVPFVPGLRVKDTTGDADLSKRFKDIHNFCIAKNVRKLRDGGIGIFITTKGTLDSTGGLYNWLTNEGNSDIVGLFRLHNETFGGTDATSDIIVVRKRVNGQKSEHAIDASSTTGVRTAEYNDGKKTVTRSLSYNRYFVEHPEYMAGEMKFGFETGNTYRPTSVALHPAKGKDQGRMLKAWVKEMGKKTFEEPETITEPTNHREEYVPTYDQAGVEVKTGTMQVDSKGRVCVNYDGTLRPLMSKLDNNNPKGVEERIAQFNKNKVKGRTRPQVISDYNEIKKALTELLDYQKNNEGDEGLQSYLDNLNRAYDKFVGYYGNLHSNTSISWLKNDVDYPTVLALETYREEGIDHTPVFGKADIFRGRVMARMEQPKPQNITDGVILSIRQSGNLNMEYIAEALGRPVGEVKKEIVKQGLGYENPTTHVMEPAHLYLSGNVREKLKLAEANNENGRYDANITALRRIVPPTVPSHMIEFSIGSSWLNPELFNEYVKERTDLNVKLSYAAGTWTMQTDVRFFPEKDKSFGVQSEICDRIIPGHELILAAMSNKTIRVTKTQKEGGVISDPKATQVCGSKVDEIREDFRSWLRGRMQQDEALATEIENKYNDIFNNSAPIEIPDEYVPERFEGAATVVNGKPLKLRPHQSKAVVRGTMQSLMLAHEVGTGKTYTLITTAMEMRRLGTAKKPMIVVQNSTLGQFVASAKALYPDARILSLEDKDRNAQGRKDFYAKIRYNDWDMVVIPQSVLEKIDDHPDRKRKFIEDTIAEKLEVIEQLSGDRDNGRMVANMKKEVEKLRDNLAELHAKEEKKKKKDEKKEAIKKANAKIKAQELLERETDDNLNFDDLGIDAILVDEAHEYKHLGFATAMQRGVKGVDPSPSKKCQGLFLKVKAIQERSGGRNVVFATGTPISNTAAEIWTFMRYLMPKEEMEAYNIWYFDDFVRNFGSIQQMLEYGTSGTYKEVNRFAGYNNLPEMARLWAGIADTVKTDEAGEVKKHIPALEGGQPTDIHLPQTSALRSVLKYVRQRLKEFEEMTGQEKKENSHIPLTMYGIAKAAAVDARLVSASAPDDPHSKTNEAVRQTLRSLKETEKYNGTVAIFADNYQRKNKQTEKVEFNLFEDIKQKLIKSGVPEGQIWIMNSGMTAKKKEDIFARVNSGEIRVIMGTTPLLGVGVNIQERLHTLMHLDAPNRPMDYWQRMGRLLRQGNLHKEMNIPVRVLRFGVEDSLDVTAYQRLKTKGAIANAVMNSKSLLSNNLENRVLEEEGDEFGQITAELSGSEYAILQNQTEKELRKLIAKEEQHRQHQTYIHYKIPEYRRMAEASESKIARLDETIALLESLPAEKTISVNGRKYKGIDGMEEAFKADNKALGELIERAETLGTTTTHAVRFAIEGKLYGEINREIGQQMVNTMGDMAVYVNATVSIPGIATGYRLKSRWLKGDINEIIELLNPDKFRRFREDTVNDLAGYNRNIETLSKDKGKPFEHTARIAELKGLLEEYTQKLQEDLAAKEKKYAEMDKEVANLDDITFTSEDDEEETEETKKEKGRELSRLVTEGNSLDFLDAQGHRSAYRYAQFVPGGLTKYGTGYVREGVRPPMTAIDSETQDWRAPMEFNAWEKSVEGMRKDNGKADLVQGNGRTTGNVAYNPYFHIRVHPLNDQFSAAYDRPELVVVEGDYPESELTSGYRAEGAKNAVGLTDWHAGSVNGQLSPGKKVQTVLSRYFKPRRIVPWSEVAERIMDHIAGEDVTFPLNVVPPRLRAELSKRGAKFHGISGSVSKDQRAHLEEVERELAAGNHDFGVEGGLSDSDIAKYNQRIDRLSSTNPDTMEGAVALISDKLNTPIRVISRKEAEAEGYRRKKGWYDRETGQITIVADNHRNVGDIADTAVHEAVGHHGLRQLFGTEEKLNNFLDEAYNISNDKIKAEIDRRTERMMDDEVDRLRETMRKEREERGENPDAEYYNDMAKARIESEKQREQIRRDATEEYASDLGMKIGEEGFERMDAEEQTFWGKLKGMLQKALDRLLAGLKLPKMRAWTDKEWSYVLWKSWRNLREGNRRSFFTEAEDIVRREKSNFGASESRLFRDSDMGLEEAITKMKADAAAANGAGFTAKQDAMRAIGGNLSKLRQAMARQREYDITTVKSMTDLSKILLDAGLLDDLSKYETKRILSAIKDAVGREDTSKQVQRLMDIMVDNQLRMGANYFGKLLSVKGSRIDARGIEVQGELDPDGQKIAQTVKKATTRTLDDIDNMMSEAMNRMSSTDQAVADEAALEYAGLQIARQYVEEIRESKNEEKELRKSIDDYKAERNAEAEDSKKSIEQARVHKDAGHMTEQDFNLLVHDIEDEERARWAAFKQYAEATNEAIRQNKIERAESYRSLSEQLGGVLGESVERAKQWREAEKQRVEEIHHNANSDMKGRPTNEHHKADRLQKFVNNGILRFLLAPLGTFDQMLRMFGSKSVRGEGYLWNRYMRGWVDSTEKEYTGYQEALKTLDKKVSEVFGKDMKWGDLFAMERRMPKASVRFWDGGEMRDHELTQGNLLYIYMVDKMTDGRMKLRRMGITEDDVERIKDFVDPRFLQLADWMQEEFLVEKRNGYNEVHKRMFGASMAAIENYFPLKILANARMENVDVADDTGDTALPATSTGSIIKRRRNNLALDVTSADAFSVILDHIQQMERWAAFAEYNRDLNTLLSYKRFRNQVMNMTSAYGAGKTLWANFRNVASMAAGAYRPPIAPLDKAAVNVAKGVTAAKVSFRMFTALKQFLSMPAYVSDSNPIHLAANIANPYKAWMWSMENLPLFEKRWKSRMAGDPRLLKSDMDWKMWRSRIVEVAGRVGMSPNAFVDALTVAIGARSMYQTKLAKYKRYGYTPEQARKRALQDATILFNQTQQSSEGAFLSTMQVDRSWLSVLFTVFRNSSMSYTRQLYDAMRNIGHRLRPGYKGMTEEFMAKQMRRDGIDPDQADRNAKQEYRRGIIRDLVRVGVFGYALQFAWNLGAYLPYLLFGKNAEEKDKMWDDVLNHSMFCSVEGLTGGDVMSAAGEMWMNSEGNPEQLTKDMPLASDVVSILRKMDKDYVSAMNDVVNLLIQSGLGFNPQSLTDAAVAVMDYCGEDAQTSRECALLISRIINCPQSQIDKIYFDEIDATGEEASTMTPEEIAERYAEYKLHHNALLTEWAYDEEGRKKAMEKSRKKAKKTMKERMTSSLATERTRELLDSFDAVSDRQKELTGLKKTDREAYRTGMKELRESTNMIRHNRVKRYNHDIKRLTEKWMNAKTPQEADSIARAMLNARERLLIDVDSIEAQ